MTDNRSKAHRAQSASNASRYEIVMVRDLVVGWRIRYRLRGATGKWSSLYLPEPSPTAYLVEARCAQHEMATSRHRIDELAYPKVQVGRRANIRDFNVDRKYCWANGTPLTPAEAQSFKTGTQR